MRCHICNKLLDNKEIKFNEENKIEPCRACKNATKEIPTLYDLFVQSTEEDLENEKKLKTETKDFKRTRSCC